MSASVAECPVHKGRDDRKSGKLADALLTPQAGSRVIGDFNAAREIYRSPKVRQYGATSAEVDTSKPEEISFFFLDGEEHRKRRGGVAGMFAAKTVVTRHRAVMEETMEGIEAKIRSGPQALDELSWQMAVNVAAYIIGLTNSDSNENLALRVKSVLDSQIERKPGWLNTQLFKLKMLMRVAKLWKNDISPAIEARRKEPKDDVISFMVKENYPKKSIIVDVMSYGGAGMMTTREFIVMAAWHLFEKDWLRERFLNGGEDDQFAILEEILRLEPVASLNHRRAAEDIDGLKVGPVKEGEVMCLNIRAMNTDEQITGPCPYELDPDRARRMKVVGPYMSFGDGPHRCPGAQVALHETRLFLDRMFRLPGIRLVSEPQISWNPFIQGYELRGAVVACDPA